MSCQDDDALDVSPPEVQDYVELDGERPSLISPGRYLGVRYSHHEWWPTRYGKRLVRWFDVPTPDEPWGVCLPRFYRIDPGARRGGKKPGFRSDFVREYLQFFPIAERLDRIPLSAYRDLPLTADVRTTDMDGKGRPLPEGAWYSVIRWLFPTAKT